MASSGQNGPLRVALAGYGLAGSTFHAPLIAATDGLALRAVVTRSADRRARLRDDHPEAVAVDALADALDDVDLVVVASPNRFHVPLACEAIAAGKHVVVDKPLAVRADEARALGAAADARGVVLSVFHNRRWDDDQLTLGRELAAGRLGRVLRVESRFDRWRPAIREGVWREAGDPADGGGLLLDLGSHLADQAVQLLGPVTTVYAELDVRRPGAVVEDDVFVALEHVGGVRSHLWAGVHAADGPPRFRVLGERGAFVSWGLDQQEAQLRAGVRPTDPGFGVRDVAAVGGAWFHDGSGSAAPVALERGRWDGFYAGVAAAIRDGAPPPVTAAQATGVLELLEAARESSRRGVVVAVA
ncbi:putative oxidoreductase YdgJ [Baekduia alba]|uniref:Gfo/Idh/MocA family protein n=1 Tax=Baekduia alba TaxID=2997333 RepID=UPI002340455D|nr:Gfo/Idh/MocA family oxidoreductase [Baekduia alba]WCB95604.1 putative oxidoreductase YdgJ [Baekduia alba]